jgi:uncharacterized protein DUF1018
MLKGEKMKSSAVNQSVGYRIQTASEIYSRQNRVIHKALTALDMPYHECKQDWIDLIKSLLHKKNITGLTSLMLSERRRFIQYLHGQGLTLYNPGVPKVMTKWRKGDEEIIKKSRKSNSCNTYPGRPKNMNDPEKGKMLKKIEAILAEAGRPWSYVHTMTKRMFGLDRVEWCHPGQLHKLISSLMYDAKRHGRA